MLAEPSPDILRQTFQDLLDGAITRGQRPTATTDLGPATCRAVDAVACAHPEATVGHIADAYDAFSAEHG